MYKMFENYKDVVTINELTEMLDIGRNKAYKLINSGEIKSRLVGKTHRIPKKNIIKYIENQID